MTRRFVLSTAVALAALGLPTAAMAVPTEVVVRAVSRDAKVIGDGVDGARITIRDAHSGEILAEGVQTGGSGDTEKIMKIPHARGATVYGTEDAASFTATLDLAAPTQVEIIAEGPLGDEGWTQKSSKTLLLVPGQHIRGEGVVLEIHGFNVSLLAPAADTKPQAGQNVEVRIRLTMT